MQMPCGIKSYAEFYGMSSMTADPNFLLQKKIESGFAKKYPEKWVPAYLGYVFR